MPTLKNCIIKFDETGGRVITGRQRDRLQGLKYWFGRGKVDWDSGRIVNVLGPLSCRFKIGDDHVNIVPEGVPGVEYIRYMDAGGEILSEFTGEDRILMRERVLLKL